MSSTYLHAEWVQLSPSTMETVRLSDGTVYHGQFETIEVLQSDGSTRQKKVRHGLGVQIHSRGDGSIAYRYNGYWQRDRKQGKAHVIYPDGSTYEGCYKKDTREGQGIFRWASGPVYDGAWKDNKMAREGCLLLPSVESPVTQGCETSGCLLRQLVPTQERLLHQSSCDQEGS